MAYKDFAPAQILTAQEVDTYLMRQSVMSFATSTARDAAITTPVEGMVAYLEDRNTFWYYDGSAWTNLGNVMRFASAAARTTALPSPVEGMISYLQDTDELQIYNGSSWLTVVVTSDDEGFTTTGAVTAASSGVDGGITLRTWPVNGNYQSLATTNMTDFEYMVLSDGTDTFISGGSGGSTTIRGGANSTVAQLSVGTSYSEFAGRVRFPNQPAVYAHNSNSYTVTDNQTLRFDVVSINRGGHYSGTNSEFYAPVSGLYYVHCQVLTQYNSTASDMRIAVNNVRVDAYSGYSFVYGVVSSHKQGHVQGIVSLTGGQYISIKSVGTIDFYGNTTAGHSSLLIHYLG